MSLVSRRRLAPPIGSAQGDVRRRNALMGAGLVDSLGLSIGWTVMSLYTMATRGLAAFGLLSAAMLIGVALSAPFTGWLASRVDGRRLLRFSAGGEATLRVVGFAGLLGGAPLWSVALVVAVSNVLAWTGFAGMRAEMALLGGGARWLAAYTAAIAAAEALGAFAAASLPIGADGVLVDSLTTVVLVGYAASLIPTILVAAGARAVRAPGCSIQAQIGGRGRLLFGGAMVTMLSTGPTLLAVGLAAGLHGRSSVGPAMLLFAIGSLIGPFLADWLGRAPLPVGVTWSFLGVLMLAGWGLAPVSIVGLLAAQLISGVSLGAFEGAMDARVAATGPSNTITSGMAWAGSTRAIGSAVAVSVAPLGMAAVGVGRTAAAATLVLALAAVASAAVAAIARRRTPQAKPVLVDPHAPFGLADDWVLVLTGDEEEFDRVAARYFDVEVCQVADLVDLDEVIERDEPLVVVVGRDARTTSLLEVQQMLADDGPWRHTSVRELGGETDPGSADEVRVPLRLVPTDLVA